ncbi:hypothetical protein EWM64_g8176 [Hericium alpestre]|uniref:Uncharacterized protein n=1 Tax=Hericium alpestre TaxID=135208 RepID=A0A4Y9ZMH9_9AGAM|nr:hypothetical protein EWM64_g8176 [Hericium alpestre]
MATSALPPKPDLMKMRHEFIQGPARHETALKDEGLLPTQDQKHNAALDEQDVQVELMSAKMMMQMAVTGIDKTAVLEYCVIENVKLTVV